MTFFFDQSCHEHFNACISLSDHSIKVDPPGTLDVTCVGMLTASRTSIRIARSYCWKASAAGCQDRQVLVASFAQPVRLPVTLHVHNDQRHSHWRCHSSKVKSMPEKQLKGKEEAAAAGQDDPAANDHYDKVAGD